MGRIKSALIKRTTKKLMQEENFSVNFGENKKILAETMPSKRIRNITAGYITRLQRMKEKIHTKQKGF